MFDDNNLISLLSKIMSPQQAQQKDELENPTGTDPLFEQRINEMFNLRHDASDRLSSYSQNQPTREQYAPGKLRQTGAFLANLGSGGPVGIANGQVVGYRSDIPKGLNVQRSILNEPYDKAVDDYQMKLKPLNEAAESESRLNTANRQVGSTLLTNDRGIRSQENLAKHRENQDRAADEKNEVRRQYLQVADYKAKNAGTRSFIDDNGLVVLVHPDGTIKPTGLHTDKLNDADKLALQIEGRLNLEDVKAKHAKELEDQKAGNRKDLKTTETPPKTTKLTEPKPQTPAAEAKALMNKYGQIISEHPEYKGYYEVKNGVVSVKKAGLFGSNETRQKAYEALHGKKETSTSPVTTTGDVKVADLTGKVLGTIKASDVDKLDKTKYKVVQ